MIYLIRVIWREPELCLELRPARSASTVAAAMRRLVKEQRTRAASSSCASTLVAKPRSKAERAAMADVHAKCASAWARAREIAAGL